MISSIRREEGSASYLATLLQISPILPALDGNHGGRGQVRNGPRSTVFCGLGKM